MKWLIVRNQIEHMLTYWKSCLKTRKYDLGKSFSIFRLKMRVFNVFQKKYLMIHKYLLFSRKGFYHCCSSVLIRRIL